MKTVSLVLVIAIALSGCCQVPHNAQEPTVVVLQSDLVAKAQPDTVYVLQEPQKKRSRLRRAAGFVVKVAVVGAAVYGARELGQKKIKWNKNTQGQKVWPIITTKKG